MTRHPFNIHQRQFIATAAFGAAALLGACAGPDTPDHPPHDVDHDGAMHARRYATPFLCGDPETRSPVDCPEERPNDDELSCDSSGCHGNFDYQNSPEDFQRALEGASGPSCFDCHGEIWSGLE